MIDLSVQSSLDELPTVLRGPNRLKYLSILFERQSAFNDVTKEVAQDLRGWDNTAIPQKSYVLEIVRSVYTYPRPTGMLNPQYQRLLIAARDALKEDVNGTQPGVRALVRTLAPGFGSVAWLPPHTVLVSFAPFAKVGLPLESVIQLFTDAISEIDRLIIVDSPANAALYDQDPGYDQGVYAATLYDSE